MNNRESWCRTCFDNNDTKSTVLDHVYAALRFGRADRILSNHLKNKETCAEFVTHLSLTGVNILDVNSQENLLNFMLGNAHLFSIYRLDDILISLIEKDYVGPRSQIIIQLAQQVLLEWILSQRSSLFNETRSVSFLRALKGQGRDEENHVDSSDGRSRNKRVKYSSFASISDTVNIPPCRELHPESYDSFNLRNSTRDYVATKNNGTVRTADIKERASFHNPNISNPVEARKSSDPNRDSIIHTEYLKAQEVAVIMSSLQAVSWLDMNSISGNPTDCINSKDSWNFESAEVLPSSNITADCGWIVTSGRSNQSDILHQRLLVEDTIIDQRGLVSTGSPDVRAEPIHLTKVIRNERGQALIMTNNTADPVIFLSEQRRASESTSSATVSAEIPEQASASATVTISTASTYSMKDDTHSLPDKMILCVAHTELLTSCREHRVSVIKSASSLGTGLLSPKIVQQISQSAALLLIRIGNLKCADGPSKTNLEYQHGGTSLSPLQLLSQPLSQLDETTDEMDRYSLHCTQLQAHALLALALHKASDDILAAVSDLLLAKINFSGKQSEWNREQVEPVTIVLFLSGVLLTRIRSLTAPASRWLLRAVEVSIKSAPTLVIPCVLSIMVTIFSGAALVPSYPQYELLQRVARQVLSGDQRDELVYHMCSRSFGGTGPEIMIQSVALLLDSLLSSVHSVVIVDSNKAHGVKNVRGKKQGNKSINQAEEPTIGREMSTAEQDAQGLVWSLSVSAALHVTAEIEGNHMWTVFKIAEKLRGRTSSWDTELMKTINTILTMMSQLSPKTARALFDHLDDLSVHLQRNEKEVGRELLSGTGLRSSNDDKINSIPAKSAAVIAIIYTIATRFSKTIKEGAALKKDCLIILSRLASSPSAILKASLTALNKL